MRWIRERLREMREELDRLKVTITVNRRAIEYEQKRIIEYVLAGGYEVAPPRYEVRTSVGALSDN